MDTDGHRARAEQLTADAEQLFATLDSRRRSGDGVDAGDVQWMGVLTQLAQTHAALAAGLPATARSSYVPGYGGPAPDATAAAYRTAGFVDYGDGEPTHDRR
ncbi:hypothetical protein Acy02nite_32970 [Actinoplanes cyaneus]|uniref:Uncharacterized protein n=1 Tax=Actinoplanes cyaneus TaxID=52696 RepID=A0A919IHV1_9ACTN|nr:hypothetical protein [Actinoplanes cyaneus]MCW2140102.1 hypothetical protein [Actinoplanes cyaneus]GID65416.1 hypothetical protein Acy02nite_32970 [Actinoplanes cyaneus]